ncbi:hypothetical protein [Labilibaculum sp.]|uniref:hypothetical protein n=1 Tax=Labilibaculum sp. TaxID=2060723 RepID=UPI0035641A80
MKPSKKVKKALKIIVDTNQHFLNNEDKLCSSKDYISNYETNRDKFVLNDWYDMTEVEYIEEQISFLKPLVETNNVNDIDPSYYTSDERLVRNSAKRKLAFLKKKLEISIKKRDALLDNQLSESTTSPSNKIHLTTKTNTNLPHEEQTEKDKRYNSRIFKNYESFLFFVHQVEYFDPKPGNVTDYSYLFTKMKPKFIHDETPPKEFYNYMNEHFNTNLSQLKSIDLKSEKNRNNKFELGTIKYKQKQ